FTVSQLKRIDLAGGTASLICHTSGIGVGGAWTNDGRILYGSLGAGLYQVADTGGAPAPLTTTDPSRGEDVHRWPQALPGGRFLYFVQSRRPETSGIYVASFAKPGERKRLLPSENNAVYAPGGDGKDYLLWRRSGALVAQEFNVSTLQLSGEPRLLVDPLS